MRSKKSVSKKLKATKTKYPVRKYTEKEVDEFFELDDKESKKLKKFKLF